MPAGSAQSGTQVVFHGAPRFLVELEPWPRAFLRNLGDLLLRREPAPLPAPSPPAPFWHDVFVATPIPWRNLRESLLTHLLAITVLWGLSHTWIFQPRMQMENPVRNQKVTYYQVSEYLPALSSGSAPARAPRKGQPAYAKQPIISIPAKPDNSLQTIVDPTAPRLLTKSAKLPNLVVWTRVPAPPVAAGARSTSQLTLPWQVPAPVPPPPEETKRSLAELNLPKPSVVEPPPSEEAAKRKLGEINIGHLDVQVAAPKLPLAEQRASGNEGHGTQAVAPPPPSVALGSGGGQAVGQLIALGLNPSPPAGPIEAPGGNRRGIFAATPQGTPGAPGTPDIAGGGTGPGGTGKSGKGGPGSGSGNDGAGIYVAGPAANGPVAVVAGTPSGHAASSDAQKKVLMAAAARPRLADIPRETSPGSALTRNPNANKIEDRVFGPKKYYSMILNMPNLTSAGGSWIIRFAELKDSADKSELTAPVAIHKVDPAYPPELMRARVEGTVTLYAVIRADGTVAGVKVLRGIDDTLDENARLALSRWQFRPATKHGMAVDLEAVVQIPFAARRSPF